MNGGELVVDVDGTIRAIYSDEIPLREIAAEIGTLSIRRASMVEPTEDGRWCADMALSGGPVLGPFDTRGEALTREVEWIRTHVLGTIDCAAGSGSPLVGLCGATDGPNMCTVPIGASGRHHGAHRDGRDDCGTVAWFNPDEEVEAP